MACPNCGAHMIGKYCPTCLYEARDEDTLVGGPETTEVLPAAPAAHDHRSDSLRHTVVVMGAIVFVLCGAVVLSNIVDASWTHQNFGDTALYFLIASMFGLWCIGVAVSDD